MNKNILTTQEINLLDQYTCEVKSISIMTLMERAAKKLYECLFSVCPIFKSNDHILVVAGVGHNGGEALLLGLYLLENYYKVKIVVLGELTELTREIQFIFQRLNVYNTHILYLQNDQLLPVFEEVVNHSTYIIDGIFGTGLNRDVEGLFYKVIEKINQCKAFVFSVDIPSGINGNNGNKQNIAVEANFTAMISNYKIGNLLNDAKDFHGETCLLDIGLLQEQVTSKRYLLQKEDIKDLIKKRKHNTHKYNYGNVLTIGGSTGLTGAALMCAYAALRTGSGLSSIAIANKYHAYLQNIYPELMIKPYQHEMDLLEILQKKHVIAFGPGLGRSDEKNYLILNQLLDQGLPLVIDADGLFYLKDLLGNINSSHKIIITPHLGEMAMLLNADVATVKKDPLKAIEDLTKYNLLVVLKGPCTIIANKEVMYFTNTGNPGMATAGSGDVLTGIILSLFGQGLEAIEACKLGVYLHSLAGNNACEKFGEYSLIATDIISSIPVAFKELLT